MEWLQHDPEGSCQACGRLQVASGLARPLVLALDEHIPVQCEDRCLQLYDAALAADLVTEWLPPIVRHVEGIRDLHVATQYALTMCPLIAAEELSDATELHVYTDGSGGNVTSGATWAFCAIAVLTDGTSRYIGSQAGHVVIADDHRLWLGCVLGDSMAAELSGLFWALAWSLTGCSRLPNLSVISFHYDNSPVGSAVFHGGALARDDLALALAVALRQVLETQVAATGVHVHSHEGHPWNELADRCCAAVRLADGLYARQCAHGGIRADVLARLRRDQGCHAQWLYVHFLSDAQRLAFPVDADGWVTWQRLRPDLRAATPSATIAQAIDTYVQPGDDAPRRQIAPRGISVASYNALTLRTKHQKDNVARQLAERNIHICGVQESRDKADSVTTIGDYVVLGSASQGWHGCQLWVSLTLPFATTGGRMLRVKELDLAVVHASPRLLVVRSTAPGLRCVLASMHGPHSGHPVEEIIAWWQETSDILAGCAHDLPLIIMMDANADLAKHRAGTKQYEAVAEIEAMCARNSLDIPVITTEDVRASDALHTTFERDGTEYTIDYVAVSSTISVEPQSAYAITDFDTNGYRDHMPTVLSILAPTAATASATKRRTVSYDRRAAQCPSLSQLQHMRALLARPPIIPYWVDTTSQQHWLDVWMQEVLGEVFPKKQKPPRSPDLSPELCALYDARGRVQGKARFLGRAARQQVLRRILHVWRSNLCGQPSHAWHPVYGFRSRAECFNIALLHLVVHDIDAQLRELEHSERAAAIIARDAALVNAIGGNNTAAMYSMTRRLTSTWTPRVTPSIALEDGSIAHGHVDTKRRWRRHFAGLMDGAECKLADVIDSARARQRAPSVPLDLRCVPTNYERASRMTKYKLKVGVGEDRLGSEILKLHNMAMASCTAAVMLKGCLWIDLPIQAKGGHIVELFKGKGSRLTCGHYRDITLGHGMLKPLAACLRRRANAAFAPKALSTQFGALHGRGTDLAHLSMRAAFDLAAVERKAIAGIFIDVEKAFARMCRSLVLPCPASDDAFISRLTAKGYSHTVIEAILARIRNEAAWVEDDGSPHLQALLTDMHAGTWASAEYLREVIELQGGTLAGNPLGDLVFTAAMTVVLKEIRIRLRAQGLLSTHTSVEDPLLGESPAASDAGADPAFEATDVSYVDDTFVPVIEEAPQLVQKLTATLEIIDATFDEHGFDANYNKGKTEVVIAANGRGSLLLKRTVAHAMGRVLHFTGARGINKSVQCVAAYKHLGSMRDSTESMAAEIKARCSSVSGVVAPLSGCVFANDAIPKKAKAHILQACLLSRVLYNAGTWPVLASAEYARLHTSILRPTRRIAASVERVAVATLPPLDTEELGAHTWLSDQQVYSLTDTCAPYVMLVRLRVMLLLRVLVHAPVQLRCLLAAAAQAPRSWMKAIAADLQWLAANTHEFEHWIGLALHERAQDAATHPKATRRRLNLVAANAEYSLKSRWATTAALKAIGESFPCRHCDRIFCTRQALAVHTHRAHGFCSDIRRKVDTHHCVACMQLLGSIERVVCHLREKSSRCMATYIASIPDLEDDAMHHIHGVAADEVRVLAKAGRKRHFAADPAIRLCGPLTLCAFRAGIGHARLLRDWRKRRHWTEVLADLEAPPSEDEGAA